MLRLVILLCGFVFTTQIPSRADDNLQIGMVLDDGRVLIYRGAAAGMKAGDVFHVAREGEVIGMVSLVEVKEVYSVGVVLEQAWQVAANDDLLPAAEPAEKPRRIEPATVLEPGKIERKDARRIEEKVEEEKAEEEKVKDEKVEEEKAEAEKADVKDEEKEEKAEKKARKKKKKGDEEPEEAVAEKKTEDEGEEKAEKAEKRKKKTDDEVKEAETEEKKDDEEKKSKTPAASPGKLFYYDRYRVRVGYIRPRGNHFDQTLAADIDRDAAAIFGLDWITVERQNLIMDFRFLYGEPNINSASRTYDGESRYMQIAVNFIKSRRTNYFDDHYSFYGLGVGYQRMGAGARCIAETGCANGVGYLGFNSSREDTVGLNLIYGYHFTDLNVEMDYVVSDGDFFLTFDYPLGVKEVYRLVEKK